ncbi:hypothetical protein K3495_g3278 [Podosphaera aphanis]|nr:hypothetical protein K3495_g3278 [Podosphaera aphanis]
MLDLIPMVAVLAQRVGSLRQRAEEHCSSTKALYDFLHPTFFLGNTANFGGHGYEKSDKWLTTPWLRAHSRRNYSSSTVSPSSSTSEENIELSNNFKDAFATLNEKMNLSNQFNPERAWKRFMNLDGSEKKLFRKPLLHYLHNSDQHKDIRRVIQLFNNLGPDEKDVTVCQLIVKSYLKLNDHLSAMKVYDFAIKTFNIPAGCGDILRFFLQADQWAQAFKFWEAEPSLVHDFNFYRFVDDSPLEFRSALELSTWVNGTRKDQGFQQTPLLLKFATTIIAKTLVSTNPVDKNTYFKLIKNLDDWPFSIDFYSNIITSLAKNRNKTYLFNYYLLIRNNKNFFLTQAALLTVLKEYCHKHDVPGIGLVLDDFFSIHSRPSRAAYRMCLKEFARQGNSETVHALFKQYINRYKDNTYEKFTKVRNDVKIRNKSSGFYSFEEIDEAAPLTSNDFAPLLHVHAKRGEVKEIEKLFGQIKDIYNVRLETLCWNIRLSAYVKVHDIKNAYTCFEEILNDPFLEPDHYTLGTMMTLCAHKYDLKRAEDILMFAKELNIPHSCAMLNYYIVCLIRHNHLSEAEKICKESMTPSLPGSKISLWNSLIIGYAQCRDLKNVNRIINYLSEINVEYDNYTYSALMQALVMSRQPYLAAKILFKVMPQAEMIPTSFNYAVLLGGYVAVRDFKMFDWTYQRFLESRIKQGVSTKFMTLRSAVTQDATLNDENTEEKYQRSYEIFSELVASIDPQDLSETARKVGGQAPLDILFPGLIYSFMAYIFSTCGKHTSSIELLEAYRTLIPEDRQKSGETLKILTAMMSAKDADNDFKGVKECWDKAVLLVKEESSPLPPIPKSSFFSEISESDDNSFPNRLKLNRALWIYMKSLIKQRRTTQLKITVEELVLNGYELENRNWNEFVRAMSRTLKYYKFAFQVCEFKLMPSWQGWRIQRHKLVGYRHKIALAIRRAKLNPNSLRPHYDTIMWLTRRLLDLQAQAAENPEIQKQINMLKRENPLTFKAIEDLPRREDERILESDKSQLEL